MSQLAHSRKQTGLGRGMDTLLPQDFNSDLLLDESERIQKIAIEALQAHQHQPRQHFNEEAIDQLALSIQQHGILQPLIVTQASNNRYTIIAGERRWRAAKQAGLKTVPVIVRSSKELEQLEIALVENVQRVDLSPLEQAVSIDRLYHQFNLPYQTIADRLGKASSTVHNIVRLLQLPKAAIVALQNQEITEGHARAILALKGHPDRQEELLSSIIKKHWSVRQAERFVLAYKHGTTDSKVAHTRVKTETPETKQLGKHIAAPISIRRTAKGGKLEIGFTSEEDLQRIMHYLMRLEKP